MTRRTRKPQHADGLVPAARTHSGVRGAPPVGSERPQRPATAPAVAPATPVVAPAMPPAAPAAADARPELERLRDELADLQRLNRLKDQYLSTAAHELATPLTAIKAYVETLAENYGDPDFGQAREFFQVLQRETSRLIRIVERTLQISRLTGQCVRRTRIDLPQLVGEVTDSMRPLLAERTIRLEVQVADALPPIEADRDLLEQVLINLVDNAAKFSPRGRMVSLRALARPDAVEIEVRDQGYGIAADELVHIFDPYFRGHDDRTSGERGIGLGLAIVKTIVEQHGGSVSVESEVGRGTAFRVSLPRA